MKKLLLSFVFFIAAAGAETNTSILVLCTGNSARSQMTEGFLRLLDSTLQVFSAGTNPGPRMNPFAIQAMKEIGIDLTGQHPKHVREFLGQSSRGGACVVFVGRSALWMGGYKRLGVGWRSEFRPHWGATRAGTARSRWVQWVPSLLGPVWFRPARSSAAA